jgi:hypothetical protein
MITRPNYIVLIFALFFFGSPVLKSQSSYEYEPSKKHPFGLPNPNMPEAFLDYAPMIGECDCKSLARIDQNTWGDTVSMTWRFKYVMNGMAVQDETLKADGNHSGSIRQFIADSAKWYVHYYKSNNPGGVLGTWEGNRNDEGDIILYSEQPAPNGTVGYYKIIFSNISKDGFDWLGQWVSKDESFSYPLWKIFCNKKN